MLFISCMIPLKDLFATQACRGYFEVSGHESHHIHHHHLASFRSDTQRLANALGQVIRRNTAQRG